MTNDGPWCLALLIAQAAIPTPAGGLTLVEVNNLVLTSEFPNFLPPFTVVAVLVGGQPRVTYTTKFQVFGETEDVLAEVHSYDAPFTTQIRRVNILQPLLGISTERIVTKPGNYTVRLLVNGEIAGDTVFEIRKVSPQPSKPAAGTP